nr:hypothetical protein [Candidatus Bathyarchaeota archaeon]
MSRRHATLLRYYMGFRVIGWIWIIVMIAIAVCRFFIWSTMWSTVYELLTGSGMMVDAAIIALLTLGIAIEWYGSFRLFRLRRKIRPRREAKPEEQVQEKSG